jgi:gas vesicle protein
MARWSNEDSAGNSTFLLGALAGALVGAGVALLMAPKSGRQVRQDLSQGFNTVKDTAARRYREVADKATQMADKATQMYEQKTGGDRYNGGTTGPINETFPSTPGTSGYQS